MRKPTDLLVILTTAVLTALIATPILSPALSHAEGQQVLVQNGVRNDAPISILVTTTQVSGEARPLVTDGLELTLKLDRESYAAGEKPTVTLIAVNKGDKLCKTKAKVVMRSAGAYDGLSRAMPMPVAVFEKEVEIEVAAGQTKKLPLETGYAVTASSMVYLTLFSGELRQHAGAFAVAAPPPQTEEGSEVVEAVATK